MRRAVIWPAETLLRTIIVCCALLGLVGSPCAATEPGAGFDYLYIVANEGGSSGGHTAIRFGHNVFHFQNQDGLLVLRRERSQDFLYEYALLGNRTLYSTRVDTSSETVAKIATRFRHRHRAQEAQLAIADDLRRDRILLEELRHGKVEDGIAARAPALRIPGLGYFERGSPTNWGRSPAIVTLEEKIAVVHGRTFLASRRRALLEDLKALFEEDPTSWPVAMPASVDEHPVFARAYGSRWTDLLAGLAALDVLEEARMLDPAAYHRPGPEHRPGAEHRPGTEHSPGGDHALGADVFALDSRDLRALERYASRLRQQLVELVASRRSDWGQTLLVGMARLAALQRSIESRSLVLLDSFPDDPAEVARIEVDRSQDVTSALLAENRLQLEASLAYFREAEEPDELAWERLEERGNRYSEMLRALRGNGRLRVAPGHLVPSRAAYRASPFLPQRSAAAWSADVRRARLREREYDRTLRGLHRYELITQNCATALFATLNASLGGTVEASETKLGGFVGGPYSLSFIPFVSDQQVNARYRVAHRETVWSYRQIRLRSMREQEDPVRVAIRESNTFTARAYVRSSSDSFFVFFTDEPVLLRPLFGAVNLVAALGESAVGLLRAPLDRGAMLSRGLRGTMMSLPELAFTSIRKGSNDWIPPEHRVLESN